MTIPRELQRSTPRPVSLSREGRKRVLSYCLKAALLMAAFFWLYGQGIRNAARHPQSWTGWGWRTSAAMLLAAAVGLLAIRRQSRLLMYGRATVARIIADVTPWWYRVYRQRGKRRLQCEFRLLSGGVCKTTVDVEGMRGKTPGPGSEVVIIYDPNEPGKAMLYPAPVLRITNPE